MFKRIYYNQNEGMVIKVKSQVESPKKEFACKHCDFVAKSKLGLISHNRKHKK